MTSSIKRLIFKALSLESYLRLIQRSYFLAYDTGVLKLSKDYSYHYYIKRLIRKGDVVIDIGANLGYYSILFARWTGVAGKVHSVEPIRIYNQLFLEKARKYKNIQLYPYALGTEEKTIEMVSSPHTGYLRTGLPHVYDADRDGSLEKQEFTFKAEMKPASLLFRDLDRIDYIKCDIEGFEYIVLADLKEIIGKHRPIVQVEVWNDNEEQVLSMFRDLRYQAYKLYRGKLTPATKENPPMEGDYIFLPQ